MSRWKTGLEIAVKSFDIARKNRFARHYILTIVASIFLALLFLYHFKLSELSVQTPILFLFGLIFKILLFVLPVPLIYAALDSATIKRTLTTSVGIMLGLWFLFDLLVQGIINYSVPRELSFLFTGFWNLLCMYTLPAIILYNFNPLTAVINSIKGLATTFIEVFAYGFFFLLIALIVGIPIFAGLTIDYLFPGLSIITDIVQGLIMATFVGLILINAIGHTLLYLYYKKEVIVSDLKK